MQNVQVNFCWFFKFLKLLCYYYYLSDFCLLIFLFDDRLNDKCIKFLIKIL